MKVEHRHRTRLVVAGSFVALVCIGAIAMALNGPTTSDEGLLPPLSEQASVPPPSRQLESPAEHTGHRQIGHEDELNIPPAPGAAALAGSPASVVKRFAKAWANRNTVLTPATKQEMVGLSAGPWANAVFYQARVTLPAIEGIRAEGEMVMMKLSNVAPQSKTALVVTKERLLGPDGLLSPPRYELYLARLDRVTPQGYAITAWEPQR